MQQVFPSRSMTEHVTKLNQEVQLEPTLTKTIDINDRSASQTQTVFFIFILLTECFVLLTLLQYFLATQRSEARHLLSEGRAVRPSVRSSVCLSVTLVCNA